MATEDKMTFSTTKNELPVVQNILHLNLIYNVHYSSYPIHTTNWWHKIEHFNVSLILSADLRGICGRMFDEHMSRSSYINILNSHIEILFSFYSKNIQDLD